MFRAEIPGHVPIDLSGLVESIQGGLGQIPLMAIGLALLAGPTVALIGYRLITVARRPQTTNVRVAALWVCQDCRSANELRLSRCYHCGLGRDATEQLEVVIDEPTGPQVRLDIPAGSPFAALVGTAPANRERDLGEGLPVIADQPTIRKAVAVGPGDPPGAYASRAIVGGEREPTTEAGEPLGEIDVVLSSERNA